MPSTLRVRPQIRQAHSSRPGTRWAAAGHQSRPSNRGVRSGPGIGQNRPKRKQVFRLIQPHPSSAGKSDLPGRSPPRLFDHSRLDALRPQLGNLVVQLIAQEGRLPAEILFGPMNRRFAPSQRENQPSPHPQIQSPAARSKICDPPPGPCSSRPDARQRGSPFAPFSPAPQALRTSSLLGWQPRVSMPGGIGFPSTRSATAPAVALSPLAAKLPLQG